MRRVICTGSLVSGATTLFYWRDSRGRVVYHVMYLLGVGVPASAADSATGTGVVLGTAHALRYSRWLVVEHDHQHRLPLLWLDDGRHKAARTFLP
jgi:hypothetical protein